MMYNELSAAPLSNNKQLANQKVAKLIDCYKAARQHGFKKIRFSKQFQDIEIAGGYSLQHWLSETNQRNLKDLILGARTYPFINEEDTRAEGEYLKHCFSFEDTDYQIARTECLGLAAAHIYDTLSVSFSGTHLWERNTLRITKINDKTKEVKEVDVNNVFSADCFKQQSIGAFIERISNVVLVESSLQPNEKQIHLRDDHGTDVLNAFAERIRNSPYVSSIINSLPWNSQTTNFIRRVYPDGKIEVVLYWTDKGLGMVIQTTGRNQRETEKIARLLEEDYSC
ncbi:MAG: hypothetical protein FJ264_09075 [Planctomycetes bacterium]|nr:hypothetical protein [Planctomycetota bacterium]